MSQRKSEPVSITVRIMGKEYTVACPEDEHDMLIRSADHLNDRMTTIRRRGKALGAEKIAVMAALNLTRELLSQQGTDGQPVDEQAAAARIQQLRLDIDNTLALE